MPHDSSSAVDPVSVGAVRSSLPRPLTSFIGRDDELATLDGLIAHEGVRLVTLTGPGGVGKTRLALAMADRHRLHGDAVIYVPLAPVQDPDLVLLTVAQGILPRASAREQVAEQLGAFLAARRLLLVLDNMEQVADAAPDLARLLERCPRLTMLATSRTRLHLSGERTYPVLPLPVPDSADVSDPASVSTIPSIQLFVERAQAVEPHFALTPADTAAVADICRLLDGLPLAIELAAARLRMLTLAELRNRLDQRLPLLTGGSRDLPERQRTIRATIAWSYDQLSAEEQRFFRQVAVFVGGFTLETAEALGQAMGGGLDAMTGITTLVDHSLIRLQPGEGDARYLMLETIREFGMEQLAGSGEEEMVRLAHAHALLALARRTMPDLTTHPTYEAVARLDAEIGNIRAALTWLDRAGRTDVFADLVLHLRWLWYFAYVPEGLRWFDALLGHPAIETHPALADVLRDAGQLAITLSPTSTVGRAYLFRAQTLYQAKGDIADEAEVVLLLGIAAEDAGDAENAEARFQRARALWDQLGSERDLAVVDYHLGIIAYGRGDLTTATALLNQASATAGAFGDRMVSAWCSWYLVLVACAEQEPARAATALWEYHQEADRVLSQSLHWAKHFAAAAVLAATVRDDETAAHLFGAVLAESQDDPLGWPENVTVDRAAAAVRGRLGDEADDAARQAGARQPRAAIVADIGRLLERTAAAPRSVTGLPITAREHEILRLIVEGKSNQQIADILSLSPRTVSTHITNIFAKLDVDSRTAAATWAMRHGIA
jgi:non-specific serine/threonine protein kinase